ncbi:MAG TPA: NADH-quinone oxidoreductase subunit H [Candidatus Saccharimonadales bacterium]|nr:NADH-quinone oxidoreductase subunit H [Candidatus Saccharimonadales bacterium]
MNQIAQWLIQILLVPVAAPLAVGIINKLKAKMQGRKGAGVMQPYRDLRKLFHKDEIITKDASWVFRIAPFIVFGVTVLVATSIPLFTTGISPWTSDFLVLIYCMAVGTFFLALAGIDTGSAFGGFGSSREMTLSAIAEGALIFSILPLVMLSGTTDLFGIANGIGSEYGNYIVPIVMAFIGFLVVLVAEAKRFPFDNPDTHLELTMIHEAMILEYSGKRLALMEWAAANKLFIFAALAANMFFPVGIASASDVGALLIGIAALLGKVLAICAAIAVVESVMPKLRYFLLPHVLFVAFILNVVAIGLVL